MSENRPFPAKTPLTKPTDRPLSAATARLYDVWNPHEDRANVFFSNFKYSTLAGLEQGDGITRRDPSKVIRLGGTYYVYYTCRRTPEPPAGPEHATDTVPSRDWDLCDVWYATSDDGFTWTEQGPATQRPAKGEYGWRTNCTPDILIWRDKYYLYYQAYDQMPGMGDACNVTVAVADRPEGPFEAVGRPVVDRGAPDDWDCGKVHDPYPLIYHGQVWLYYKSGPGAERGGENLVRAQGVAIADDPLGPFEKSPLNPVTNSGHETCLWPFAGGIAAMMTRDGPEKNTIQYAPDGLNFEVKSMIHIPPLAGGPFVPDAFANNGDGRGITWGLCHTLDPVHGSQLLRFDCDLSLDVDRPGFKQHGVQYNEAAFLQPCMKLWGDLRRQVVEEREQVDRDCDLGEDNR